ncbi:hypothetical protein GCM10023100_23470 [Actinocorallia cavernae]|uniref:Uncharacterized protein n=2 Tax=Actinomycetes TaxID=1760 RepID=A0ABP8SJW6_9ACTN
MRVAEWLIRIQLALPVRDPARAYYVDPTWTAWEGLPDDESARDYLRTTSWRISMPPERSWDSPPPKSEDLLRDSP